ncbi:hypothetical protein CHARACLAT_028290 [Characodon lateralis]|uniref:BAAT/Acyl-CoA thioester hydrolase C-terminal domain-containing protein n=1 Tax=Characodon lateralis TaxID=208331 RepID=A0ABU7D4N6_9TELE|nr:hypothetical protein [Characodon lateralis]
MENMVERLTSNGKENFETVCYPGAGHLLEPPYGPFCSSCIHFFGRLPVLWGGEPRAHAVLKSTCGGRSRSSSGPTLAVKLLRPNPSCRFKWMIRMTFNQQNSLIKC